MPERDSTATKTNVTRTPGPWYAEWRHPDLAVWGGPGGDDDTHVASIYGDGTIENADANARLIAAAPDLLDALKAMVASYDGLRDSLTSPVVLEKLARADAAIAKAEGRS